RLSRHILAMSHPSGIPRPVDTQANQLTYPAYKNLKYSIMKTSKNEVTLRGFLGNDPEVNQYATDKSVARVRLATNEGYKKSTGEWVNETMWHNLVFWGKQASSAELNLKKGML
ncbi:single-stranded DNA-binding protein, partial [Sphingobacterium hotanense]|uniref:single-stranded DNA-binding protein n=1 Tax=Sphingobacterium hotanense TaxID=649196 RepID=UPI0021A78B20